MGRELERGKSKAKGAVTLVGPVFNIDETLYQQTVSMRHANITTPDSQQYEAIKALFDMNLIFMFIIGKTYNFQLWFLFKKPRKTTISFTLLISRRF